MKFRLVLTAVACGAIFAAVASAAAWDKKTKVTFSGPAQVPGVTLPAGSYIFKLVDSSSNRSIVQVTNVAGNKTYATILAIPDYRLNATSKTVMYFTERAKNAPMAIKSWFYPGDNYGQRFVYPKVKAVEIAAASAQPVPAMEAPAPATVQEAKAEVVVVAPNKTETPYNPEQLAKTDATDTAGVDGEPVKEAAAPAAQLPKTASPIHLAGGLGGLLIGAGLLARSLSARLR